jgi:hypothetical protein
MWEQALMLKTVSRLLPELPLFLMIAVATHLIMSFAQTLMHYRLGHRPMGGKFFRNHISSILLFDPRREHSSIPTAKVSSRRAQGLSRLAASSRPPEGLGLDWPEHGGMLERIGAGGDRNPRWAGG